MDWLTLLIPLTLTVVVIWLIATYNNLVALKNRYKNAFAQIEVQLKRRHDLIPNLVETARAYMAHESATLEAVVVARNEATAALSAMTSGGGVAALADAESVLQSALSKLSVTMEAYPDLKASANMQQLTEELSSTENRVAFARQGYNDSVLAYNTYRQAFPAVLVAAKIGHGVDAELLVFADSAAIQEAPKVSF
jgi:LemA protein